MVAGLRVVLAVLALAITYVDPSEPSRFEDATYAVLMAYLAYSAALYAASREPLSLLGRIGQGHYWVDVAVYVALVALSGGSNSIYFVLFFFGILVAAFRDGFVAGMQVTLVCVGLFVLVSVVQQQLHAAFDLGRFLIRSSTLPIIGYLISYWGGREVRQVRELAFLNELGQLANPRLDVDRIMTLVLDRLREFFAADTCVVITRSDTAAAQLWRVDGKGTQGSAVAAESVPAAIAASLLGLEADALVLCRKRGLSGQRMELTAAGKYPRTASAPTTDAGNCDSVAELLEAVSFVSAPLRVAPTGAGRLNGACSSLVVRSIPRPSTGRGAGSGRTRTTSRRTRQAR